jgi:hypothetical protein
LGELIVDDIYRLVYHGISYGTQNERNNMIHRETNFEVHTDSLLRGFFWGLATSRGLLGSRYTFAAECPGTCMSCTRKNQKKNDVMITMDHRDLEKEHMYKSQAFSVIVAPRCPNLALSQAYLT